MSYLKKWIPRWNLAVVVSLSILSLVGCSSATKKGAVGVDRQQMLLVSEKEMTQGAIKAYQQVLAEAKQKKTLNTDPNTVKRLRTIANRLIPQTQVYRKDALNWQWEVNLIRSDQLNAWCMPGGKIAFYTGIINKLGLTDGEIAAIMGHEISHALREHGRERASQAMLSQAGLTALSILTGMEGLAMDATSMVMQATFILPNSRTHEIEADRMGVELAARGGYNPYDAVSVWKKMAKISKNAPPEFLSTHPAHDSRIKDLTRYAKKVMPLYRQSEKASH